jgi:hypothetical protein
MKTSMDVRGLGLIPSLVARLGWATGDFTESAGGKTAVAEPPDSREHHREMERHHWDAEQRARPHIERQRRAVEQEAERSLDRDAIAAIKETENAIRAIVSNDTEEALRASNGQRARSTSCWPVIPIRPSFPSVRKSM